MNISRRIQGETVPTVCRRQLVKLLVRLQAETQLGTYKLGAAARNQNVRVVI